MSESVHAPHPVKQPNLTRKFPMTDMPTGLMATWSTALGHFSPYSVAKVWAALTAAALFSAL